MDRRGICLLLITLAMCAHSARAEEIVLTSGETLTARVIEQLQDVLRIDHPILGELDIPVDSVQTVDGSPLSTLAPQSRDLNDRPATPASPPVQPVNQTTVTGATHLATTEESPPPAEATVGPPTLPVEPAPKPKATWKSAIEFGANVSDGRTQDANLRMGFRTSREAPDNLLRYDATYRLSTRRGDRTENRFTTGIFNEWRSPEVTNRWSSFVEGRFDTAEFQSWDQRLTGGAGLSYRILKLQDTTDNGDPFDVLLLTTRLGGGVRKEFGSDNSELAPEGLLAAEFRYQFSPRQNITGATTLYPDLRDTGEFRVVSKLDWTIAIDSLDGMNLKFGVSNEYESRTDADIEHSDLAAYATLVVNF